MLKDTVHESSSSITYIKGPVIIEGVMRINELKKYLEDRDLPLTVWSSEDGTRITGRLQFDPGSNQIVGLLLPLDNNGMPIPKSFVATSASAMDKHVSNNKVTSIVSLSLLILPFFNFSF